MRGEIGGDAMSTARRVTGWRKLAGGAWRGPDDPLFYGELDMDATTLLSCMDSLRVESGVRVTVTHLIGRAVAHALAEVPELNVRLARAVARPGQHRRVLHRLGRR